MATDPKLQAIIKIFHDNGCDIYESDVWKIQNTPVVTHKALERLAAKIDIDWDLPKVIRAERNEAVVLVSAKRGNKMQWSIGEALIATNPNETSNYRVSGKQAAYIYAMAEKRAKDRVILKLAGIEASSEEEAEELKRENATVTREAVAASDAPIPSADAAGADHADAGGDQESPPSVPEPDQADHYDVMEGLLQKLAKVSAPRDALELMLTQPFQARLATLPQPDQIVVMATGIRKMFEVATTPDMVVQITTSATVQSWLDALGPETKEQTLQYGREVHAALKANKPVPRAIPDAA